VKDVNGKGIPLENHCRGRKKETKKQSTADSVVPWVVTEKKGKTGKGMVGRKCG